jgi:radical SAM enzyme (TIGR01210 family)
MYPAARVARDRFILDRRGPRKAHDPWRYQNLLVEDELTDRRTVSRSATVFLTGKECPWRCVMCDLWQHTTSSDTPRGAIPVQIAAARQSLIARGETVTQIKLYNASNFFDPHAVPDEDYQAIALGLERIARIVVESHPALIGDRLERFLGELGTHAPSVALEVAMGLETANPEALERLNKGLTVEQFASAAEMLRSRDVALRVFLLIAPPFISVWDQDRWLGESIDRALVCGATAISLIPTRAGNGTMEALAAQQLFRSPGLDHVERSFELALARNGGARIFVDTWELERCSSCRHCFDGRRMRLTAMNLEQRFLPPVSCAVCGHGSSP